MLLTWIYGRIYNVTHRQKYKQMIRRVTSCL